MVHRCLSDIQEICELEYNSRRFVSTPRIDMEHNDHVMPVLGNVACGEGQEEPEEVIKYIRMTESLEGNHQFHHRYQRQWLP